MTGELSRLCLRIRNTGQPLSGSIAISGAKNGALPLLAAALFSDSAVTLTHVPVILDTLHMMALLKEMGVTVDRLDRHTYRVNASTLRETDLTQSHYFHTLRYSILLLYPLLKRWGTVTLPFPGGCQLDRGLDCHLKPLSLMGFDIDESATRVTVRSPRKPHGFRYQLDPAHDDMVGFTESAILAAMLTDEPVTLIRTAAEPEVVLLLNFLKKMGLTVHSTGVTEGRTDIGIFHLRHVAKPDALPITQANLMDRIETGSWMGLMAVAPKRSRLTLTRAPSSDVRAAIDTFQRLGIGIDMLSPTTLQLSNCDPLFSALHLTADHHPHFPTDLQPILISALCGIPGTSYVQDRVFSDRWGYVRELQRAHAQIHQQAHEMAVTGTLLQPATMTCLDLRGAWAVLMAGASMTEYSTLTHSDQLFRGYEDPLVKLRSVGLDVALTDASLARDLSQHPLYRDIQWLT